MMLRNPGFELPFYTCSKREKQKEWIKSQKKNHQSQDRPVRGYHIACQIPSGMLCLARNACLEQGLGARRIQENETIGMSES